LYTRTIEDLTLASEPLVTLSATYGANGHRVGAALALQLGVPFVDTVIPAKVGEQLGVSAVTADVDGKRRSRWTRFLDSTLYFADVGVAVRPEQMDDIVALASLRREVTEDVIRQAATEGGAVIYGRGAGIVLKDHPRVFRVRLDGPVDRRIAIIAETEAVETAEAKRLQVETDKARADSVRKSYGVDVRDSSHYHLVLDSTLLTVENCVDLIVEAQAAAGAAQAAASASQATASASQATASAGPSTTD